VAAESPGMPARTASLSRPSTLATAVAALVAALIATLALSPVAQAQPAGKDPVAGASKRKKLRHRHQVRHHSSKSAPQTAQPAPSAPSSGSGTSTGGSTGVSPATPTSPTSPTKPTNPTAPTTPTSPTTPTGSTPTGPSTGASLEAGFENDLANWNVAGVGEVMPTVTTALARTGTKSCRFTLTGSQNRSELILGGNGTGSTRGTAEFREGAEYWYGFSIYIKQMVYGKPGAHNLFMQFKSDGTGSPEFGLQLWNVNGKKGLWTGGPAQEVNHSGERFLAPMAENAWHDIQIHFKASETGNGFYEVFLDGTLVDARTGVTMIVPGHGMAYIKDGLYRNGATAPGTSEVFLDAAKLGTSRAAVLPS
jgi:Polysaccharide lyase